MPPYHQLRLCHLVMRLFWKPHLKQQRLFSCRNVIHFWTLMVSFPYILYVKHFLIFHVCIYLLGFSICSSQTEDIANSITRALSSLDNDVIPRLIEPNTGRNEVEEQRHVEPLGIDYETEEYVLEDDIDLPEQTLISSRSN